MAMPPPFPDKLTSDPARIFGGRPSLRPFTLRSREDSEVAGLSSMIGKVDRGIIGGNKETTLVRPPFEEASLGMIFAEELNTSVLVEVWIRSGEYHYICYL